MCRVGKSKKKKKKKGENDDTHGRRKYSLFLFTYVHRLLAVKVSQNLRMVHGLGSISRPHFIHSFQSVDANIVAIHTSWQS